MNLAKQGLEIIPDMTNTMLFERQITNNDDYKVYQGLRKGLTQNIYFLIILDTASNSCVVVDVIVNRIIRRFLNNMYTAMRAIVYQDIYDHFYMSDINFGEEF